MFASHRLRAGQTASSRPRCRTGPAAPRTTAGAHARFFTAAQPAAAQPAAAQPTAAHTAAALSEHECSAPLIECGCEVRPCTCMCSLALSRNPPPALRTAVCTAASRGDLTALDGGAQLVGGHSVAYGRANTGRRWTMDSGGAGPCLLRLCLSIQRGVQCKTGERREGDEAGQAARGSREKGVRQCSCKQSSIGVQL